MTGIIVAFPKQEDAKSIKNILVRSGFTVSAICTTGAAAAAAADELGGGIMLCSYKLMDMVYSELREYLPEGFEMLLMASGRILSEIEGSNIVSLAMPLKVHELVNTVNMMVETMERRKRLRRAQPRERKPEEVAMIQEAKHLLMERNHMTEEEAHRYIQKCSMDSSTNMVETAQMVLSMMNVC
ncbi:MAG: ANTAR domain-containing protein [Lachnospiraceae bacterium]|nr:ANTAR domain-containing protein [Lachnospiraceae bacterium]